LPPGIYYVYGQDINGKGWCNGTIKLVSTGGTEVAIGIKNFGSSIVPFDTFYISTGVAVKIPCQSIKYVWKPGNFTGSNILIDIPSSPARYTVRASNQDGCETTDSILVYPADCLPLFIPNLITPNDDGDNDIFKLRGFYNVTKLEIYNRWGTLIYHSEDYKNDWDAPGESDGIYYYNITSKEGDFSGWVQIVNNTHE
ncbi:MAG: gliding motility-associated C-terminal domain-containing protein, partial [Cytophagaceae bacterium]|nr:gliding motility-associated C-terminal domain-containing protein [Cytophagaceae bacterium]